MNQRIKELAVENGCTRRKLAGGAGMSEHIDRDLNNFAVAIIQECATILEQQHTWITNVAASNVIKKHFGIEQWKKFGQKSIAQKL